MMGISMQDQATMWRAFSRQLKAGDILTQALTHAAAEVKNEECEKVVGDLIRALTAGTDLSEAMGSVSSIFSRTAQSMMRAGEAGGVIDVIAERLADGLESGAFPVPGGPAVLGNVQARLWRAFAILVSSGVPVLEAFDLIAEEIAEGSMRKAIQSIRDTVVNGEAMSTAMRSMPDVFDARVTDAIEVGEGDGNLDKRLYEVADALDAGDLSSLPRPTKSANDAAAGVLAAGDPEQPAVVKLVNKILLEAIDEGASDIHVDHAETSASVRYRVAGVLREKLSPPKSVMRALVTRLKIMAALDVAECRKPQDGKLRLNIKGASYDIRVSTLPAVDGESVVMRIIPQTGEVRSLDSLGLANEKLDLLRSIVRRPYGLVLVSGPAGSGKTTLLYALINEIDRVRNCVVTVEDPVTYRLPGVRQVQVNRRQGLTPAAALRSIMRQDPDVIVLSDLYEAETAHIATEAAASGHLVFVQLHAQTSTAAIQLMLDLGVERYRLNSCLAASISQRLVRKLCDECKTETALDEDNITEEAAFYLRERGGKTHAAVNCDACSGGYRGRVPIHEIMMPTAEFRRSLRKGATEEELRAQLVANGMKTMLADGLELVADGVASLEDVWQTAADVQ